MEHNRRHQLVITYTDAELTITMVNLTSRILKLHNINISNRTVYVGETFYQTLKVTHPPCTELREKTKPPWPNLQKIKAKYANILKVIKSTDTLTMVTLTTIERSKIE